MHHRAPRLTVQAVKATETPGMEVAFPSAASAAKVRATLLVESIPQHETESADRQDNERPTLKPDFSVVPPRPKSHQ